MIHQLRIHDIFDNKEAFHARFCDHAWRIMRTHGFTVIAFWESVGEGRTDFIYLLEWPEDAMHRAWAAFMADEESAEIKRVTSAEHGDLVSEVVERTLVPTACTPALTLQGHED